MESIDDLRGNHPGQLFAHFTVNVDVPVCPDTGSGSLHLSIVIHDGDEEANAFSAEFWRIGRDAGKFWVCLQEWIEV